MGPGTGADGDFRRGLINDESNDATVRARTRKMAVVEEFLNLAYNVHVMIARGRLISDRQSQERVPPVNMLFPPFAPPSEELDDFQRLLMFFLERARSKGYRKQNGRVFRKKMLDDGKIYTHSFVEHCSMEDFMYAEVASRKPEEPWRLFTKKGNAEKGELYLTKSQDPEFPKLVKDQRKVE